MARQQSISLRQGRPCVGCVKIEIRTDLDNHLQRLFRLIARRRQLVELLVHPATGRPAESHPSPATDADGTCHADGLEEAQAGRQSGSERRVLVDGGCSVPLVTYPCSAVQTVGPTSRRTPLLGCAFPCRVWPATAKRSSSPSSRQETSARRSVYWSILR